MASTASSTALVSVDRESPHLAVVKAPKKRQSLTIKQDSTLHANVTSRIRAIGGLHRKLQSTAKSLAELAKELGDHLITLKQTEGVNWTAVLAYVAERHGLGERSAQVYMQIASRWHEVVQSGADLEGASLRSIQRLITAPKKQQNSLAVISKQVCNCITEYFEGTVDQAHYVDGDADGQAFPGCETVIDNLDSIGATPLHGNVVGWATEADAIEALIRHAAESLASKQIAGSILVLPARIDVKWATLVDSRPRVYVREDGMKPGKEMLVGLIDRKHLSKFGAVFSQLGAVHFPYELLRHQS